MEFFITNIIVTVGYTFWLLGYNVTRNRDTYTNMPVYNWVGIAVIVISFIAMLSGHNTLALLIKTNPEMTPMLIFGTVGLLLTYAVLVVVALNGAFIYGEFKEVMRFPGAGIYVDTREELERDRGRDYSFWYHEFVVIKVTKKPRGIFHPESLSWKVASTHTERASAVAAARLMCNQPKPLYVGQEPEKIC